MLSIDAARHGDEVNVVAVTTALGCAPHVGYCECDADDRGGGKRKSEGGQPCGLAPFSGRSSGVAYRVNGHMQENDSRQTETRKCVRLYIDAFNMYHAIVALGDHGLKWLNPYGN
jgi:hypothetical protein